MHRGSIGAWVRNVIIAVAVIAGLLFVGEQIGRNGPNDPDFTTDEYGNVGINQDE